MALAPQKQDANLVGFYKIREATLGVVPATGAWQTREPNSFDDLGAEYTKVARKPFSPSRQRKKGSTTDMDADGGYNEDLTQNNMKGEFEEFFFAAMRQTHQETGAAAVAATDDFTVADSTDYLVGSLVFASGYTNSANNGIHTIGGLTDATHVSTTSSLVDEAGAATKKLKVVGFAFATADVEVSVAAGVCILTSTVADFTDFGLVEGSWVFYNHGDTDNVGYARIAVNGITATTLTFDKTTWTPVADDGTGMNSTIYFSDVLKNEEDPDLIVRYSSVMERTLGRDADGVQSEYLTGAVASELTWNSPLANLVNIDMAYIGQKADLRTGALGPLTARASNTVVRALGEDAFNTSSNVYRLRMAMVDPATLNPTALFARVTEWTGTINNNVTSAKAQGVLGGFDTTVGNFDVDAELTAYFSTTDVIHAVKCNWDVTFDAIYAKQNAGMYIDLPLVSLGGGRLDIEQDAAIMVPLNAMAAESPFGHTALVGWFDYLPDEAMPDLDC